MENNQKELWRLFYKPKTTTTQKIMIQEKLAKITIYLTELYDVLPVINAVTSPDNTYRYADVPKHGSGVILPGSNGIEDPEVKY